jgi:hypothetical protein
LARLSGWFPDVDKELQPYVLGVERRIENVHFFPAPEHFLTALRGHGVLLQQDVPVKGSVTHENLPPGVTGQFDVRHGQPCISVAGPLLDAEWTLVHEVWHFIERTVIRGQGASKHDPPKEPSRWSLRAGTDRNSRALWKLVLDAWYHRMNRQGSVTNARVAASRALTVYEREYAFFQDEPDPKKREELLNSYGAEQADAYRLVFLLRYASDTEEWLARTYCQTVWSRGSDPKRLERADREALEFDSQGSRVRIRLHLDSQELASWTAKFLDDLVQLAWRLAR